MSRSVLLAGLGLTALASAASAQTSPSIRQPGDVEEIVVTALPFGVPEESLITNVDVLTQAEVDTLPTGGLGEALSGLPGVRSSFFGPGASRPVVRGLAGPRVLVLTNGVGLVDASALSPDHQVAVDPAEARRIEVLRGPAGLAYGGSAIGGVVNIIDERVPETPARGGYDGRLVASASSVDDGWSTAGNVKLGQGPWVFAADALHRKSEDYRVPVAPESRILAVSEGEAPKDADRVENTAVELTQYGAGVSYVTALGFVGLSVKRTETFYGVPGHGHEHEHAEDEGDEHDTEEAVRIDLEQTRVDLRGELDFPVGPFATTRLAVGYADYQHTELEGAEVGTRFLSEGVEGRLELVQPERDGWNGAVGVSALARDLTAIGEEAYVPPTDEQEVALFTVQRVDRGGYGFEAALRLDTRELDSTVGARDFTNVSASAGVFARPATGWFVGLTLSRTARAPTEAELFADGAHVATGAFERGDAGLESESNTSVEVGAHYGRGRFELDLHAFYADYSDFIDLRPTGEEDQDSELPVFVYRATDAQFVGTEVEGALTAWEQGDRSVRLEAAYDFVRGESALGAPARIPPWSATFRVVYDSAPLDARVEVRRVGEQDRLAEFELPTEGYTQLNAFLSWRPIRDGELNGLTLFLDGRNLTDEEAREHASFLKDIAPLPGRNLRAGVRWSF